MEQLRLKSYKTEQNTRIKIRARFELEKGKLIKYEYRLLILLNYS